MLRKEYRSRYVLFGALSLLVHLAVIAYLAWNPIVDSKKAKGEKTVQIKLNQTAKKKASSPEKEKAKKKKEEQKKKQKQKEKQERKDKPKVEKKKDQAKEAPKKKQETKKEPKKKEPKQEPPKPKPKKQEQKKPKDPLAEKHSVDKNPKKNLASESAKLKSASQPKGQASKAKKATNPAKKEQAKATKKPAPKTDPSKPKAAKEQTKQLKAKPSKDTKQEAGNAKNTPQKPEKKAAQNKTDDQRRVTEWKNKLGNMKVLDDRAMKRAIVTTQGFGRQFKSRTVEGKKALDSLNRIEKQEFYEILQLGANAILENYVAPKKDGKKYHGEISILLDKEGYIDQVSFKKPSGNRELDMAMYNAVLKTPRLVMPEDPAIAYVMYIKPITLWYTEEDMAD